MPTLKDNRNDLAVLLKRDWRMLVGGELVTSTSGETMDSVAPHDGSFLARVPLAGPEDVDVAVRAARAAFPAWWDTPLTERAALIRRLAGLLDRARDFGLLDAADVGNPVTALTGEAAMIEELLSYTQLKTVNIALS